MALPVLPLIALAFLLSSSSSSSSSTSSKPKPKPSTKPKAPSPLDVQAEKERIVRESRDIIHGKRDAYTDDDDLEADAADAATAAVQILEQDETPKPVAPKPVAPAKPKPKPVASKPKPSVEVGPVTVRDGQELDDDDEDSAHDAPSSDVSSPKPIPDGYDPGAARREAIALNNHLKRAGKANYDRRWLQRWQRYAGIDADKIYGGQTRGALIHFGVRDPVPPFYKPFETERYVPPEAR